MSKKETTLILVFYIDKELFSKSPEIITQMVNSVDEMIKYKELNAVAFFMPTTTHERIECINPAIVTPEMMDKINVLIKDIEEKYSVGGKIQE